MRASQAEANLSQPIDNARQLCYNSRMTPATLTFLEEYVMSQPTWQFSSWLYSNDVYDWPACVIWRLNEKIANLHDDFGDEGFDSEEIHHVHIDSRCMYVGKDKFRHRKSMYSVYVWNDEMIANLHNDFGDEGFNGEDYESKKEAIKEFESNYAKQSGLSLQELHELGGHGEPCNCREKNCLGWQMIFSQRINVRCGIDAISTRE